MGDTGSTLTLETLRRTMEQFAWRLYVNPDDVSRSIVQQLRLAGFEIIERDLMEAGKAFMQMGAAAGMLDFNKNEALVSEHALEFFGAPLAYESAAVDKFYLLGMPPKDKRFKDLDGLMEWFADNPGRCAVVTGIGKKES